MKVADLFADLQLGKETEFFSKLDSVIARAEKKTISVTLKLDDKAVQAQMQALTRGRKNALTVQASLDTKAARAELDRFIADARKKKVTVKVDLDTGRASLEIDRLQAKIKALSSNQRVRVSGSVGGAGGGAGGGLMGALLGLSPAAVPLLATATGGVIALGGALTAAAAGAGAFGAVAKTQFGQVQESLKGVEKAQLQLDKATTPAQRAAALKNEAAAYKAVDLNQLGVLQGTQRLSSAWKTLNKEIEVPTLVTFNGALSIARQGLGYIEPLALQGAGALKGVENNVGRALGSPYWKSFGQLLTKETGPSIKSLTTDLGNLAHGGAGLLTVFLPVVHDVERGLEGMTKSFAGAGQSDGLKGFVSYVRTEGPVVVHTLGDLAHAIGDIGHDALPIGGILLTLVDDGARLISWLDSVNPAIVTLGVGLLSAVKLAPLVTGLGKSIGNFGSSLKEIKPGAAIATLAVIGIGGAMAAYSNESAKAQAATNAIDDSFNAFDTKSAQAQIQALQQNVEGYTAFLQGHKGFISGTVAELGQNINPFASNDISEAKNKQKDYNAELKKMGEQVQFIKENYDSLTDATGLSRDAIDKLAKSQGISTDNFKNTFDPDTQRQIRDALKELDTQAGLATGTLSKGFKNDILEAQKLSATVTDVAAKVGTAFTSQTDIIANFQLADAAKQKKSIDSLTKAHDSAETHLSQLQARAASRGKSSLAQQQALVNAQDKVTASQQKLTAAQAAAKTPAEQLQAQYGKTLAQAQSFVRDTSSAIQRGLDPGLIQRLLEAGPQKAEPILNALLSDHSGKTIALANKTESALARISEQAVEFARTTALAVASPTDKLSRDLPGIAKVLSQKFAQGGSANVFTIAAKLDTSPARIAQLATEFGVTLKGATQLAKNGVKVPVKYDYPAGYIGPIPPGHAVQHVQVVYDYPALMPGGSTYSQQVPAYTVPQHNVPQARAFGGPISGPGSGTSDSILARVSRGEFVVRASSAARHRPLLEAINRSTPAFATGGPVDRRFGLSGAVLPGLTLSAPNLPTGGLGSTAVYTAALAAVDGSLKALLASTISFIQRDLPAALKGGASGIAGATQQMIDQLADLRNQYVALQRDQSKADADVTTARKKYDTAKKADQKSAKTELDNAIKAASSAKKAVDNLSRAGASIKSTSAFRAAEAQIIRYSAQLQRAANQNDVLDGKIQTAKDNLDAARQTFKDYAAQVSASVVALGDFTQMQTTITDQSAIDSYTQAVNDATTALNDAQSAYDAAFGTKSAQNVLSLSDAQDIYNATVTKYGDSSANAQKAAQDLAGAQQRAASAASNLSTAQASLARSQGLLTAAQAGRSVTGADIVANVSAQVAAAQKFADNIKTLRAAGLSGDAIKEILAAGPTAGAAFADALAQDLGDIGTLNSLEGQLTSIGNDLGATATGWFNQSGIDAAAGILAGLKSQKAGLEDYMKTLGGDLAGAFKDALGIHSPSRVFAEDSAWIPKGIAVGIEENRHHAVNAARGLATDVARAGATGPVTGSSSAASGSVGGGSGVHIHGDVIIQDATDAAIFWQQADFHAAHSGRVR